MTEQRKHLNDIKNTQLEKSTKDKLDKFNRLRGAEVKPGEFWDLVVITALDEEQRCSYEVQLKEKILRGELPLSVYHVFADPPGGKIGNGGSTLHVLQLLRDQYGESLSRLRVILIHAGGWSQRLPHVSALGKIFMALPLGDSVYQMLDLKLLMYVDFPAHMNPGVLVTCADDVMLYNAVQTVEFTKPGFTAFAHPSPLSIGQSHGVFVLEHGDELPVHDVEYRACLQFLHKPSVDVMHRSGAVFMKHDEEMVYTDSTYYISHGTVEMLLDLFQEIVPLRCEIDAYGDFLQSLGTGATADYTNNTENVMKKENDLVEVRKKIFQHLRGTQLNVIILNDSKFYHLGTMKEFLFHLTGDLFLREELGLQTITFSSCSLEVCENKNVCVIQSIVHPSVRVREGSVVEFSRLEDGVELGQSSIISSCWVDRGLSVPSNTFMNSFAVFSDGRTRFVTVAFAVHDDLKKTVPSCSNVNRLEVFGVSVEECVSRWGLSMGDIRVSGDGSVCNLWTCCMFPVCEDMRTAFSTTLQMVRAAHGDEIVGLHKHTLLSLQEILQHKDLVTMLKFRNDLHKDILWEKKATTHQE
ncbi:serine/threonine-protein kinase TNNI3K isoform X2 [Tachysurus fulvidraco]|uniref:serine/threonine-protein kinase TNNI3K isoform X2 n=1 Tax=Tachysurus fulvidraco TaxID=1234273 RepID=UPI001FEDBFA9|nr:serine/threonine-protein kinase TNNI3K isoform X2 [Tachysurus fulvidraco]